MKKYNTESFIQKCKEIHGDLYNYSKCNYVNSKSNITIICPIHGEFNKRAICHTTLGQGCPKCSTKRTGINKRYSTKKFIELSKEKHGNKYDYSKVNYIKSNRKVVIICPFHGEFAQVATDHISGSECKKCSNYSNYLKINYKGIERSFLNKEKCYLYIIRLFNDDESFYKVGITKNFSRRQKSMKGYKKEILSIDYFLIEDALKYEDKLLTEFKKFKYIPKNTFPGMYECLCVNPLDYYYEDFERNKQRTFPIY